MPKKQLLFLFLLVGIVTFAIYVKTVSFGYTWDDKIVVEKNPRVQKGISGVPLLFTKYKSQYQYDHYGFRPIALSSLALDYSLSKGSPHFMHLMNIFYYFILCTLIFIFISILFKTYHPIFPLLITVIFLTHTIHVEAVANIKSRDEILCMLFCVLSLICWIQYLDFQEWKFLVLSLLSFILAYLSKENSITVIGIFPLVFLVRKINLSRKAFGIISFSLLATLGLVYIIYQYANQSTIDQELTEGLGVYEENIHLGNSFLYTSGVPNRLANASLILLKYLRNFIVPYPLVYYYGYNMIPTTTWNNPIVWLSLLIHLLVLFVGIKHRKLRPEILFGFLFYLITISIFTHIVRPLSDTMADRFLFIPSLGLIICLVGIVGLILNSKYNKRIPSAKSEINLRQDIVFFAKSNKLFFFTLIVYTLLLAGLTINRNNVWKDDLTLVTHDLPFMENCSRAHYYYASLLNSEILAKPNKQVSLENTMIKHYKRSMEISNEAYLSYLELGTYYCRYNRFDEGLLILEKGVELFPEAPDMTFYLGQTYVVVGKFELAVPLLEKSTNAAYNQAGNYYFLSLAYSNTKQFDKALSTAKNGMQKFPEEAGLFYDAFGHIYFNNGMLQKSIEYTKKLLDFGRTPQQVYGTIIGRCYSAGDTDLGNTYKMEAELQGIRFE